MFTRLKKPPLFYTYKNNGYTITIQDATGAAYDFYNCTLDYAIATFKRLHGIKKKTVVIRY